MTLSALSMPLFPLSVFLLPQGKTRLRIFEQKYLKLVAKASASKGFVLYLKHHSRHSQLWGSWVEITNFNQGHDGVLEIDVKCKALVTLDNLYQGEYDLTYADITVFSHWSEQQQPEISEKLSTSLVQLIRDQPLLTELYSKQDILQAHWVVARWLELLPLKASVKTRFIFDKGFEEALGFIENILLGCDPNSN